MRSDRLVTALLLVGPAALLGGALGFQYLGGLAPCEMCLWQRWALVAALGLALLAWATGHARAVLALAALAVLAGAGIAAFHVGVEQHWWEGITSCAAAPLTGTSADVMSQIMAQPLVRCDAIAWSLFGISMAGWNVIGSTLIGGYALWRLK
ncbi:MAG: disulfide bond formation protein B [Polymorphobacter sp.]